MKNLHEQLKLKIKANDIAEKLIKDAFMDISSKEISKNNKFKIEYFKDNLTNLISKMKSDLNLDEINKTFEYLFDINDKILYNEATYLNGYYPKILISTSYKSDNQINGICSLSYDNNKKLCVNFIITKNSENFEDNLEEMETFVDFIKIHFEFDELILKFKQDKFNEHDQNIDNVIYLLEKKLGFNWIESDDFLYKIMCYSKNENITDEINNNPNSENIINNKENNILIAKTLSVISIVNDYENNNNFTDNKYYNLLPIYTMLSKNNSENALFKMNQDSIKLISENDENFEFMKTKLLSSNKDILKIIKDKSLCNKKFKENMDLNSPFSFILSMEISFDFKNIQNFEYNNYYYNYITSSNMIKIFDKENEINFYLIPSTKNNSIFLFFAELSEKSKSIFIDENSNKNIYQAFNNYSKNIKNMNNDEEENNIFVPCFNYEKHLESENLADVFNSVKDVYDLKMDSNENNNAIGDEFSKMSINKISNAKNSFKVNMIEDDKNVIIKNDFICGIVNVEPSEDLRIFLLQLAYVQKENWIKKND